MPAMSKTENNLGERSSIQLNQGGNEVKLDVITFTDTVCMLDSESTDGLCLDKFQFYAIDNQVGLQNGQDGIVGLAPKQTDAKSYEGPLFFDELARAGLINRAVFGLFISRFESKPHSIQIGDYDDSFVEGGDEALDWY